MFIFLLSLFLFFIFTLAIVERKAFQDSDDYGALALISVYEPHTD